MKTPNFPAKNTPKICWGGISSVSDYSAFGVQLENRVFEGQGFRYGFQSQERDDEVSGKGNSYSAEFWQYDSRTAKRWNIDPVVKEHESPYACFANNPIRFVDVNGADTSGYTQAIQSSGYSLAVQSIFKSETFQRIFNSFTTGENKNIHVEFQAVPELKSFDTGAKLDGQVQLMYDGKNILTYTETPENLNLSKFTIVVQFEALSGNYKSSGGNHLVALKGVTFAHEILVHLISDSKLLQNHLNSETFDFEKLVQEYKESIKSGEDHKILHSGKNTLMLKVANEVVAKQSVANSMFRMSYGNVDPITNKLTYEKEKTDYGTAFNPLYSQSTFSFQINFKHLWRMVFDENIFPISPKD